MRIATWNINSLNVRLERVEAWIRENEPDVLVLQETKCTDAAFPHGAFSLLGYESAHHGNGRWNGVAIVSKVGLTGERAGFFDEAIGDIDETRVLSASCGGIPIYSVYVPNGRVVDSEFYVAKLAWLEHLRADLDATCKPGDEVLVAGDFNVALEDRDVYDITQFNGATHITEPDREAVRDVLGWGLVDAMRVARPDEIGPFSWWDYRAGAFHKGWGMRIDLLLVSTGLEGAIRDARVDRDARKKVPFTASQPSDHAPVFIDLER